MKIEAANEFVIVEIEKFTGESKTDSGIIMPGAPQAEFQTGKVLSVGKEADQGFKDKTVLFGQYAGTPLNETTLAIKSTEVVGTLAE